ncbi:MAG: radical SAM protein [Actinomycetota bacterium]
MFICYLDQKCAPGLPLQKRILLLDRLVEIGGIWLQLTGGEALSDPHFEATYRAAWERGFLVTVSTNAMFLSSWIDLFRELPPKRVVISLYGGSNQTYAAMTGEARQAYDRVAGSIRLASTAGLRLRVSVIATKLNRHEIESMEAFLREVRAPYHIYTRISPTLAGNPTPMEQMANIGRPATFFRENNRCAGGVLALHVHPSGRASPCKHLTGISADLFSGDDEQLRALSKHPGCDAPSDRCANCRAASQCTTCGPILRLYEKAGIVPAYVCAAHPSNEQMLVESGVKD